MTITIPITFNVSARVIALYHMQMLIRVVERVELRIVASRSEFNLSTFHRRRETLSWLISDAISTLALIVTLAGYTDTSIGIVEVARIVEFCVIACVSLYMAFKVNALRIGLWYI